MFIDFVDVEIVWHTKLIWKIFMHRQNQQTFELKKPFWNIIV